MGKFEELLRELLLKRGIDTVEDADIFLNPDYERDLHDPFLFEDMERACGRIKQAIEGNEKILIYADYDADGIPGAVILHDLLKKVGYENFEIYIPERNSEGYGLNKEAVEALAEKGINLLITIDLGITAVAEVELAQSLGVDVIVTDHHLPRQEAGQASLDLPEAYAILNPKVHPRQGEVDYPEKMLCGAGVIFKLVQGFLKKYGEEFGVPAGWEKWLLDMAGIATLSDMVPLTGENRAIAYFGMVVLRKSRRPGLQALLKKMRIDQRYLSEDDIGFMVTPRLNAASRMDSPMRAFELLSTTDDVEAGQLAGHLTKINDERKQIVKNIMRELNKTVHKREEREVMVLGNPDWKVGVLGLVAGKATDEYKKPVFVWGKDENDMIKGSCRSDGSVSVVELMSSTSEYFIDYGGHELAGGFTVHTEKVHFLEEALSEKFGELKKETVVGENEFDVEMDLKMVNQKNFSQINKLAPFGMANPKPIFLFKNVEIKSLRKFGKHGSGEHLEITFADDGVEKKAISFFSNEESFQKILKEGEKADLYANFDMSYFRGRPELRLRVVDIV